LLKEGQINEIFAKYFRILHGVFENFAKYRPSPAARMLLPIEEPPGVSREKEKDETKGKSQKKGSSQSCK
jgi:hypothetical protein